MEEEKVCRGDEKIDTSSKFGSFIILATFDKVTTLGFMLSDHSTEHALIMLSSLSSESESDQSLSEESSDCWWTTDDQDNNNNNNNDITCSSSSAAAAVAKYHQVVFKVDNNLEEDQQQQQQQKQMVFKLDSLGFPPDFKRSYHKGVLIPHNILDPKEIVGSSNGLVCLYDRDPNKFYLWNPATQQFRSLPDSLTIFGEGELRDCPTDQRLVAFGFDVKTNDYKVVLITNFRSNRSGIISRIPMECLCRVQVYSLRTDSWRFLKGCGGGEDGIISLPGNPFSRNRTEVLYLNGSCFFQAHFFHSKHQRCIPENNRFIISLDLTKEIITPIQLPYHRQDQELYLFSYLGDKKILLLTAASVFVNKDHDIRVNDHGSILLDGTEIGSDVFDIWELNEYGGNNSSSVKMESWTHLHSFEIEREELHKWNIPIGISNDGDFALLETSISNTFATGKRMKLYSLRTKKVKGNFLSCSRMMSKVYPYKPSQVSIIGGNGATAADGVIGNGATKI